MAQDQFQSFSLISRIQFLINEERKKTRRRAKTQSDLRRLVGDGHELVNRLICYLSSWDNSVEESVLKLERLQLLWSLRPIHLHNDPQTTTATVEDSDFQVFHEMYSGPTESSSRSAFPNQRSRNGSVTYPVPNKVMRNMLNCLTQEHGMGPRESALICGYTGYHRRLESSLAELKKKEMVVDFTASWCGTCHQIAPFLSELAKKAS